MAFSRLLCALAALFASGTAQSTEYLAFGPGGAAEASGSKSLSALSSLPQTRGQDFGANWALEVGGSLVLLNNDLVSIWDGSLLVQLSLGPLTTPVGAAVLNGLVYVACFGTGNGDNGLAVIDVAAQELVATHLFPQSDVYVHNAFAFEFGGQTEIFVAAIGNPWSSPPVPGLGLVRFDRSLEKFDLETTVGASLHARSAKQQPDGSVFVLTQNPPGEASTLARLEELSGTFVVVAATQLPSRADGGEGGADVILGAEVNTLWASDRQDGAPGKLHYYRYHPVLGLFSNLVTRDLGVRPRYTTALSNGDIVSCNQGSNDLSLYPGLALQPLATVSELRIPTVSNPMFFLRTSVASQAIMTFV